LEEQERRKADVILDSNWNRWGLVNYLEWKAILQQAGYNRILLHVGDGRVRGG
jgi:hypothetical protein